VGYINKHAMCKKRRTFFYYIRCVMRFRGVVMSSSGGTRSKSSPPQFLTFAFDILYNRSDLR